MSPAPATSARPRICGKRAEVLRPDGGSLRRLQPSAQARSPMRTLFGLLWTHRDDGSERRSLSSGPTSRSRRWRPALISQAKVGRSRLAPARSRARPIRSPRTRRRRARLCPKPKVRRPFSSPPSDRPLVLQVVWLDLRPDRHRDRPENRDEEATCARSEARLRGSPARVADRSGVDVAADGVAAPHPRPRQPRRHLLVPVPASPELIELMAARLEGRLQAVSDERPRADPRGVPRGNG